MAQHMWDHWKLTQMNSFTLCSLYLGRLCPNAENFRHSTISQKFGINEFIAHATAFHSETSELPAEKKRRVSAHLNDYYV